MLHTELQNVWDTFVQRVDHMFLLGRELPLCLHPLAIDVLLRKTNTWKQEMDNWGITSTSISPSYRPNNENVSMVPESDGMNVVKNEVVSEEFHSENCPVHSSNAVDDGDASNSQVLLSPAHIKKEQDYPDVSVKDGVHTETFTSLVKMSGDEESVSEFQDAHDRFTDKPMLPVKTETKEEQDEPNDQQTESNTEPTPHSDNENPSQLPDTFNDVDSDSHPNDVEENVNAITNNQLDNTQSEYTQHAQSDFNLSMIKKIIMNREKSDIPNIRRPVGRPRKEEETSAENDPDSDSEKRVVKKQKIMGTNTPKSEESKVKKEPKIKRPIGRPPLQTSGEELVKTAFCDICSKGYTNENGLRKHMEIHVSGPWTCPVCGNVYHSKSGYSTHMRKHKNAYHCPHCDFTTGGKTWLDRHIQQVHRKDDHTSQTFICDICAFPCITNNALEKHRLTHIKEKIFGCDQCDHVTHAPENLRTHIRNVHEEKYLYECKICGDKFKYKNSYLNHELRHYSAKPVKCPECDFRAVSKNVLWKHKRTHKDRSHQCDICKKMFTTKDQMRRHRVIHTGEKPFACTICSYRCNVKGNLKSHLKNVHNHESPRESKRVEVIDKDCPKNQCEDESDVTDKF